jgi:ubiquinone/menaquinone biosynthesis C-methylase UbiE
VGPDAREPYLCFCRERRLYDELVRWDLNDLPLPFRDKEFDVVTAIEVIEHLPRATGLQLLREAERVARRRVIVTTPQVFFERGAFDGNPYQAHRLLWRDFARLGYRVYGSGSFLFSGKRIRWLSEYLSPFARKLFLSCAELIIAVKDLKD